MVNYIPTSLQFADIFTKSLPHNAFVSLRFKIGVHPPPTSSLRGMLRRTRQKRLMQETTIRNALVSRRL